MVVCLGFGHSYKIFKGALPWQRRPKLQRHSRALIAAALALTATAAQATTFNIVVTFGGGLTSSQQSIFAQAEAFWESVITGYRPRISIPALAISAVGVAMDGAGGVLGSAGPSAVTRLNGFFLPTAGEMEFDTADLTTMENNGSLLAVIQHEMAHVMGFGTLWTSNSVYVNNSGQFTGASALAAYRAEFDPSALFVPVDIVSGPGTRNGHWSETWAGGGRELMTGFLDTPTFVSNTTIRSFADIGYTTVSLAIIPLPAGAVLLLGGLGVLGAVGARRRRTE